LLRRLGPPASRVAPPELSTGMHDPDRCGYGEGPNGCISVHVTRVKCGLKDGPKTFTWARNERAGMLSLLFSWDTPDAMGHVSRS